MRLETASGWNLGLRLAATTACFVGVVLISWTTATGPHHFDHYVWDWDSVPYLFIAVCSKDTPKMTVCFWQLG